MDSMDARNHTRRLKLYFFLGCVLLSIFIHCLGLPKEDIDQLMALMMKQLQIVVPEDRNSFVDLCVTKGDECTDMQFAGSDALFSWRSGVDSTAKIRFWGTYKCVYRKKLEECPADGGWTEWSTWSMCRAECEDRGWQTRTRVCENPKPHFGGEFCEGLTITNRSCIGLCKDNANGEEEAKEYMSQTHSVFPGLENICIKKHCFYEEVRGIIKDKSKVDKYWSSVICVKYNGPCPVNGGWGPWAGWSGCSVQCGHGEVFRKRECNNPAPKNGGIFCLGAWYETSRCLEKNCSGSNTYAYTDWTEFSACSESCGIYGVKTSIRSCLNDKLCYIEGILVKEIVKTAPCYGGECPQIGGWSKWGAWTSCSAKCGSGRRARMRRCDEPAPSNGVDCPGPYVYVESCDGSYCIQFSEDSLETLRKKRSAIIFSPLEREKISKYVLALISMHFNSKNKSYWKRKKKAVSTSRRKLFISGQEMKKLLHELQHKKHNLVFNRIVQNQISTITPKADFRFASVNNNDSSLLFLPQTLLRHSEASNVIHISQTYRKKHEAMTTVRPQPPKIDEDDPFNLPLNADLEPLYTAWSDWTHCTQTCGGGTRYRKRKCNNKKTVCRGEIKPVQFCNMDPCPVPGGWGTWMSWSPCSVTCGSGVLERYRACNNPLPSYGGSCSGVTSESQPCSYPKCPPQVYTPWTFWSACTATCGGGTRIRYRAFWRPVISETVICNAIPCSENGLWAAWGGWSTCSLPCGLGSTFRDRTCTDPAPSYGGEPCDGPGSEIQTCFAGPCVDEDDIGVLLRGTGYLQYSERGKTSGFLMVFLRIRLMQEKGTLFHHASNCHSKELKDCDLSIMLSVAGKSVFLEVYVISNTEPLKILSTTSLEVDQWQDIFVIVTEKWAGIRLNDETQTASKFPNKHKTGLNFDGILTVGANRLKQDGIHGVIGVLRMNFKVLLLFNMKSWSGYGAPADSSNVDKIQLPLEVRHPDFKGRYYSHLFFRKSTFLQVLIIFHLTGINGLLFFNGGMDTNSSVAVMVRDGALEFCLNCGEKPLCRKAYELKTGQWYLLRVSATGNEEQIRMNDGDAMQIMCPVGNRYLPRSSIYVGGAGSTDWTIIVELTKNDVLFHGMIDTLTVNDMAVTYKMSSLVDVNGWVNSLGYSLADHVTEVYEQERATTTLRCGVPEKVRQSHLIRIIWLRDMKRIVSGAGTEIVESESLNQTVSTITLHSSHHSEGVYACLLSSDGILINLHVFVVNRYVPSDDRDKEAFAEWILFLILLVLIVLVCCPLVVYFCTKDHPFWDKLRKRGQEEEVPLLQESEESQVTSTDEESTSVETSASVTPEKIEEKDTSASVIEEKIEEKDISASVIEEKIEEKDISASVTEDMKQDKPADLCITPEADDMNENPYTSSVSRGNRLTFAEQIAIKMPPRNQYPCIDPAFERIAIKMPPRNQYPCIDPAFERIQKSPFDFFQSDYPCPTYQSSVPCHEWNPCSTWEVNPPCQPCTPNPPCTPSQPYNPSQPSFSPCDVHGHNPQPNLIKHIDFFCDPYDLSRGFQPCNFNQNNPSTKCSINNAAIVFSSASIGDQYNGPTAANSEDITEADKKLDVANKNVNVERKCSEVNESCDPQINENNTGTACGEYNSVLFDGNFTSNNKQQAVHSNICNLQLLEMSVFRSNQDSMIIENRGSDQTREVRKEKLISIHEQHQESKQLFDKEHLYPVRSQDVRHSQYLQNYQPRKTSVSKIDPQKHTLMMSDFKDESQNSTSKIEQTCSQESKLASGNIAVDPEFSGENGNSSRLTVSKQLTPTTNLVRTMKRKHKRSKSISKWPDANPINGHEADLHRVHEHSDPSKKTTQTGRVCALQTDASSSDVAQLTVTESTQYFEIKGGKISEKKVKQKPQ